MIGRADLSKYTDTGELSSWGVEPMKWAVEAGLISGMSDTKIGPRGTATRAQCATIVMKWLENVVK